MIFNGRAERRVLFSKEVMRAIILAAGRGMRLQQAEDQHTPKCLLSFDGTTLRFPRRTPKLTRRGRRC